MKWARQEFELRGEDDFVRLDGLCAELLRDFYAWLQEEAGGARDPIAASPLAHAADRYVRDFLVDFLESGPTDDDPKRVRQYLGNWYIVQTLEPTHEEVETILDALERLYAFLPSTGLLDERAAAGFRGAISDRTFYHRRLEEFWELTPDGIAAWRGVDDYRPDVPAPTKDHLLH